MALVVMDKTKYITKCEALLQDNSIYQHLSKGTSPTIHKELIKVLPNYKNNNFISETEYTQLRPHSSNSQAARCYGLPKIPKNNVPMHPIVSVCGTATYNTAKFITKILQNYCGKTSSFLKDSTYFTQKIKHLCINPKEETLVSFDDRSFFTIIPVPVELQVIKSKISTYINFTTVQDSYRKKFIKLLEFTITNCIFCFNKKFCNQLEGAAMGSPVSPVIANIYTKYFKSLGIPSSLTLIKWWFSYVDDVHSATRKDQVNTLQEHLSFIDPHIKFTIEIPGTDGLPFLDTLTKSTPTSIESTVHRKPSHTDRYLDFNSNHPISAKLSVIHTLIHRAKQVCYTPEFLAKEMDHPHKVLQDKHYRTQFFQQGKPQQKSQTHPQQIL